MGRNTDRPPPVLMSSRVLEFALLGRGVEYSGRSNLFRDGKEVGPVPRLAVVEPLEGGDVMLLHCGRAWSVKGIAAYPSVTVAKQRAERIYRGSRSRWIKTGVSKADAKAYLSKMWKGRECSFCARRPDQIQSMISAGLARICDICVREFHESLSDA